MAVLHLLLILKGLMFLSTYLGHFLNMSLLKIYWLLLISSICQFSLFSVSSTALILSGPRVKSLIFKSCWYPGDSFWKISNMKKLSSYDFYLTPCHLKLLQTAEEIHFFPTYLESFSSLLKIKMWPVKKPLEILKKKRKEKNHSEHITVYRLSLHICWCIPSSLLFVCLFVFCV